MLYKFQWNELSCIWFNNFCLLHHIVSEEVEHLFLAYGNFVVLGPHTVTIIYNLYILLVEMFLSYLEILWNHLNSWRSIFRGYGIFVYSCGCHFVDVSVFSVGKVTYSFKICFHRGCKFVGEGYQLLPQKMSNHKL